MELNKVIDKALSSGVLTREEIIFLLSLDNPLDVNVLIKTADTVRRLYCGDGVHIRALIEFSNYCAKNCNYCGLRRDNSNVTRYRMPPEEIVALCKKLYSQGLKTMVLQSGEDGYYTADVLAKIISDIKKDTDAAITICVGERSEEDYAKLKAAGADRYLLRHETANAELYSELHPDSVFEERINCLDTLKKLGFQTGTGCMVGLPNQNIEKLADDIEFIQKFQPDMVGIGPFICHPDTPLSGSSNGSLDMALKMTALTRIVTRNALIPATTAMGSIQENGRELALQAGADVVMPNYTPLKYRVHYEIYPNKRCQFENPEHCHFCMRGRIESIGRTVAEDAGHSRKS